MAEIATDPSLNYNQAVYRHGSLQYVPVYPNTYGSPINLTAGQTPVTFNLPTEVFNFGKSILMYTLAIGAQGAANYTWLVENTISEIAHIQVFSSNSQFLCDIDNLQNYWKIVTNHETAYTDYLSQDPLNPMYPSNVPINTIPALRVQSGTTIPTPSSINYTEPA